jgi:uncharacterized protein
MNEHLRARLIHVIKPIGYALAAAIAVLALYIVVLTASAINKFDEGQYNTITVSGTGKGSAEPNIARITFTVQETASSVAAAQESATKRMDAALAAVAALGVENDDFKTIAYNVYPQYADQRPCYEFGICPVGSPRIIGYQVEQSVEVTVRDTTKAGEVIAAVGDAGVQNISGPNFEVDEDSELANQARSLAIDDAQRQAKQLARELDVRLGDVVSFYEEGNYPQPMYGMGGGAMDAQVKSAPALPPGVQDKEVRVQITYRIH